MSDVIKALTIAPNGATHIGFYGDDIIFIKEHEEARSDAWGVNSKQWQEIEDFDVSLIYGIRAIKDVKIEAGLLNQIEKIKAERDALAAQVARLDNSESILIDERDGLEIVCDKLSSAIAKFFNVEFGGHSSANCPWLEAQTLIEQHTLAETRAEAGRAGFVAGCELIIDFVSDGSNTGAYKFHADEYAAKVRQGGE